MVLGQYGRVLSASGIAALPSLPPTMRIELIKVTACLVKRVYSAFRRAADVDDDTFECTEYDALGRAAQFGARGPKLATIIFGPLPMLKLLILLIIIMCQQSEYLF